MKRYFNLLACLGSLFALSLHSSSAEAIFASVKSTGMAATSISYPLDSLAAAYNPAGLADVGDRIDIEAGWVHDWGHAKVSGNSTVIPPSPFNIPQVNGKFDGMRTKEIYPGGFGFNKNWCFCDFEVSTGLIFYNRNYQKTTYKTLLPLFGTSKAGLEYLNQTLSPVVALTYCGHTIGVSANYQVERLKVNGLQNFDRIAIPGIPGGSVAPGSVTNRGYGYSTGWGVTFGYYGHITDCLTVGVTYQPETTMTKMHKYRGFLSQHGRLNIPRKIGAGIAYRFMNCLVVAFDVEQIRWKPIKALSNPLLQNGFLEPLGASNGPGFGFRDQWYYRVGAEWTIDECWTARIGFRHANTPVRRNQTAVNVLTLDCVEDFITVGGTWNMNESSEISALFAYGFEHTVKGRNSVPSFLGGGEVNTTETKYALGLAYGYKF